jgi:branched-chain amino acid transport system permease protein
MELLLQLFLNGLAKGSLYAIIGLGFGLIYITARVLHIAHGAVYTAGAYLIFSFFILLKWPFYLSILLSLFGVILLGILMELFVYRPFYRKNAPLVTSFISSLGLYILLQNLIALIYGNQVQILTTEPQKTFHLGSIIVSRIQIIEIALFILIAALFYCIFSFTRIGKSLKALSNNSLLAEVVGINIKSQRLKVFAVGSFLAGLGAILSAYDTGLEPTMGLPILLVAIVAVIVGGSSVFEGALLGGIIIGVLEALSIWKLPARWESVVVFLVLVFFLLFKPEGLLGIRRRLEELKT